MPQRASITKAVCIAINRVLARLTRFRLAGVVATESLVIIRSAPACLSIAANRHDLPAYAVQGQLDAAVSTEHTGHPCRPTRWRSVDAGATSALELIAYIPPATSRMPGLLPPFCWA